MQPIFSDRDHTEITSPALKFAVNSMTWNDQGGPAECRMTATGTREALYQLTAMLRYGVDIYDDLGVWCWGGYVSEINIGSGAYSYGAQIDSMANKIAVAYSYIEPGTNEVGQRKTTAFASDATSIAEYGTKEAMLSESGLTDAAAEQKRDTAIEAMNRPQGIITWGAAEMQADIICRGWFDTLGWMLASWPAAAGPAFTTNNADLSIGAGTAIMRGMQQITIGIAAVNVLGLYVYGRKVGAPTDNFEIGIYALDSSGNPTGSSLAGVTTAGTAMGTANATIGGSVTEYELLAGTAPAYAVQVSRSGTADPSNYYVWRVDTALGYSGGTARTYGGTVWSALATPADGYFSMTVNNKVQSVTQINDLTEQYGQFIAGQIFEVAGSASPALSSYRDGDTSALEEIGAMMETGTTSGLRILAEVDKDRRVIWKEQPTAVTHYLYSDGSLTDASGNRVTLHRPPYGVWVQLADVPATADTTLLIDASTQYVSGAEWTAGEPGKQGSLRLDFRGNVSLGSMGGMSAGNISSMVPLLQNKFGATFRFFDSPLTSTSWDGDAYSTTAKTLIDVSATFTNASGETVPGGVKAVLVRLIARDSGSAASTTAYFALAPNSGTTHAAVVRPAGVTNDAYVEQTAVVPCDTNGDVYYQINATGAGTMDCWIEVWGYAA